MQMALQRALHTALMNLILLKKTTHLRIVVSITGAAHNAGIRPSQLQQLRQPHNARQLATRRPTVSKGTKKLGTLQSSVGMVSSKLNLYPPQRAAARVV